MLVGQLLGDDDRAGGDLHAFDRLAADAHEVGVDQAGCAVERALVAALGERQRGQRARRAGAAGQHGVGLGGEIFSTWPVTDVSVRA